jgi:hypothetical protein
MEYIYNDQCSHSRHFTKEILDEIRKNDIYLDSVIRKSFGKNYLHIDDEKKVKLDGQYFIIASILKKYTKQLLKIDGEHAPFDYISSEFHTHGTFPILNGTKNVNLHGYIDRIDKKEHITRIIDYKTGNGKVGYKDKRIFSDIADLFEKEKDDRPKEILQLFMYAMLYQQETNTGKISPAIIFLRNLFDASDDFTIKQKILKNLTVVEDFNTLKDEFDTYFNNCLQDIFDKNIPFTQAVSTKPCQYCAFTEICNRATN